MAKTYCDVAIEQMMGTVEEAISRPINWGVLSTPMNEAIDRFRVQLGVAIEFRRTCKRALAPETPYRESADAGSIVPTEFATGPIARADPRTG